MLEEAKWVKVWADYGEGRWKVEWIEELGMEECGKKWEEKEEWVDWLESICKTIPGVKVRKKSE